MKTIDKTFLAVLRNDINTALKSVGEKHGIVLNAGNCRFTPATAEFKLAVSTIGDGGVVVDKFAQSFKALAKLYGFEASDLGREFKSSRGERYIITGLNPKAEKFPVLAKHSEGRIFKFSNDFVLTALGKPKNSGLDQGTFVPGIS